MNPKSDQKVTLWWLRLDLRLTDNPALSAAIESGRPVVPVYIFAPGEEGDWGPGGASNVWLHYALEDLDQQLRSLSARLILRKGSSLDQLKQLIYETNAIAVYWNRRYEPIIAQRDAQIEKTLQSVQIETRSFNSHLLNEPESICNKAKKPFQVYTPFWKECDRQGFPLPIKTDTQLLKAPRHWPPSEPLSAFKLLPRIPWHQTILNAWTPTQKAATQRLQTFIDNSAEAYAEMRDRPDKDNTSCLSPYLHFGQIGPRQIFAVLKAKGLIRQKGGNVYLRELVWREFAYHLLHHFPETPEEPLRKQYCHFPWKENPALIEAWQKGRTGYPIVDAGMLQLYQTGWLHNRVRMIVASFLVKHLLQPWQVGAQWFWDTLVDADLASNTMGWQWTAGCGADAAPYFRIFNPILQGIKFDPEGHYVRHYLPVLKRLPNVYIHKPWEAPPNALAEAKITLGEDYPHPIIDHNVGRQRAMNAWNQLQALKP